MPSLEAAEPLFRNAASFPLAALVLVQQLRLSGSLPMSAALVTESLAFATLQTGPEFRAWRAGHPSKPEALAAGEPVLLVQRSGDVLELRLNRPSARNAISMALRDALCEALDLALVDMSVREVRLTGTGPDFCAGGNLNEFGQVSDPATAHWIRMQRLPAARLVRLGSRVVSEIAGAAIGAGLECAAFSRFVTARSNAWFQLPELRFGLIPGAGGTVSLPRRIGRQRTAYLALSLARIDAKTALAWGLVDAIED